MYRFLLTPRWLGGAALALLLAALCVLLGSWQWDRREQRLATNEPVLENYDDEPRPLARVLPPPDAVLPRSAEWTPVRASGEYLASLTLLLRNRPLDGQPGYHVLVPLRLDDGRLLVVDRGWLPTGRAGGPPDAVPRPPAGPVDVVVRLRPPEPPADRVAPGGELYRIDPAAIARTLEPALGPAEVLLAGAYGVLDDETPAPAQAPVALPRPPLDEGPHLSYSLQWFVFAAGVLVGYGVLARRAAFDRRAQSQPGGVPSARRRRSAEQEEDALLDAADEARSRP